MLGSAPIGSTPIAAAMAQDGGTPSGAIAGTCSLAFGVTATIDQPPLLFTVYPGRIVSLSMGGVYRPDVYRFIRHTLFAPNGGPSGDIAGTSSLTFGPTATLAGAGTLAAARSVTFTVAGTLTGSGALAGASAMVFSTTASADGVSAGLVGNLPMLVGKPYRQRLDDLLQQPYDVVRVFPLTVAESLSGQATVTFSASATLTGFGALAGTSALAFSASATFDAAASPTYTVYPGRVDAYSFGGVYRPDVYRFVRATLWQPATSTPGVLEGTAALTFSSTGAVTGAGALAGTTALTFTPTATAAGSGALAGASALTFATSATAIGIGSGDVAGTSALTFTPTATISGAGALAGTSAAAFTVSGTLVDASGAAGSASLTFTPTATLTGIGALAGTAALAFSVNAAFEVTAPQSGGDDKPEAERHRGWDKKRATLKRNEELRLAEDITALYRKLTGNEATAERAKALVQPVSPDAELALAESRALARRALQAQAQAVEIEIALRLLADELQAMLDEEDEIAIAMILAAL